MATSPRMQSTSPKSSTRTSSKMEESEKTKETEELRDSYYNPDDYCFEESGYDSDMFKRCWENDF